MDIEQTEFKQTTNWGGEIEKDGMNWYAARLFTTRQKEIVFWFQDKGLCCFVPMEYRDVVRGGTLIRHVLLPVVRNLIFLKKDRDEKEMRRIMRELPYKLSIIKKTRDREGYYEIPHRQMIEFQIMCNPEIEMRKFLSEDEAKLKDGTLVLVQHGPLKGLSGKLVRSSKKYYLLKEVPGMAVMIKVSRWCCSKFSEM